MAAGKSAISLLAQHTKTVAVNIECAGVNIRTVLTISCSGVLFNIIGLCMVQKNIWGAHLMNTITILVRSDPRPPPATVNKCSQFTNVAKPSTQGPYVVSNGGWVVSGVISAAF